MAEIIDILTSPGFLQLCIGPMFAGKTTHLLGLIKHFNDTLTGFIVVKPLMDNRYSTNPFIVSHDKQTYPCLAVDKLADIDQIYMKQYILIEEGQFFPDLYDYVKLWLSEGKYVYVAGLMADSDQKPFGDMIKLVPIADEIKQLHARCACGKLASFTSCCVKKTNPILVGGNNMYKPTCRKCYNINLNLTK